MDYEVKFANGCRCSHKHRTLNGAGNCALDAVVKLGHAWATLTWKDGDRTRSVRFKEKDA
jgi:hypothetical protein